MTLLLPPPLVTSTERLSHQAACDRSLAGSGPPDASRSPRRRLQDELSQEESDEDGCYDDQERGKRACGGLSSNQRVGVRRYMFASLGLSQSQTFILVIRNKTPWWRNVRLMNLHLEWIQKAASPLTDGFPRSACWPRSADACTRPESSWSQSRPERCWHF